METRASARAESLVGYHSWIADFLTCGRESGRGTLLGGQLRQCPDRYTIRAGQNLPDKEFRYLRTVIVTAAVYWGFNSELSLLLLTFQHRAGVTPYTSSFDLA